MEKEESERMQQIFKSLEFDSEECSLAEKLIMMFTDGIIGDINLLWLSGFTRLVKLG